MVREAKAPSRPVCWSLSCVVFGHGYLKAFTEAKRLNKQQDLAWIFGQFQEPSKAKNKTEGTQIRKAFELPAKHSLEAVVVLCLRGFGKKREVANLWSYAARAEHFLSLGIHEFFLSF